MVRKASNTAIVALAEASDLNPLAGPRIRFNTAWSDSIRLLPHLLGPDCWSRGGFKFSDDERVGGCLVGHECGWWVESSIVTCLLKECLSRFSVALDGEPEINKSTLLIDDTPEISPFPSNADIGLINIPRAWIGRSTAVGCVERILVQIYGPTGRVLDESRVQRLVTYIAIR